jgi:ribonuclease HII
MFVAGVCFEPFDEIPEALLQVRDSKKLTETQRDALAPLIKEHADYWFCVEVTADAINKSDNVYWLRFSTAEDALREAFSEQIKNNVVVYDGNKALRLDELECASEYLVKGDGKSFSIAAASILAKAAKDSEMRKEAVKYPEYDFEHNKGYFSPKHKVALKQYGMCPAHRHKYCKGHL